MEIRNLTGVPLQALAATFNAAFEGYYVPLSLNEQTLAAKIKGEHIQPELSAGVFDQAALVGFILTGVGIVQGRLTAYNAGTGVVPPYRGQSLTLRMYQYLLPALYSKSIHHHQLEVITANKSAQKIYQKIGFESTRLLNCYKGTAAAITATGISIEKSGDTAILQDAGCLNFEPTWQNKAQAIYNAGEAHEIIVALKDNAITGYAAWVPETGRVKNLAVYPQWRHHGIGQSLLAYLQARSGSGVLSFINVDDRDAATNAFLKTAGLQCFLQQYEMRLHYRP